MKSPFKKNTKPKHDIMMNFDQLFKQISPEEISDNVFTLVGKDFFGYYCRQERSL